MLAQSGAWILSLIKAEQMRFLRVKRTEVEKTKRFTVYFIPGVGPFHRPRVSIPVGHVTGFLLDDAGIEITGSEIDPALVRETHIAHVDQGFAKEALAPPIEEFGRVRVQPKKTEI